MQWRSFRLLLAAAALAAAAAAPLCGIPCASNILPGANLTPPTASVVGRWEAAPDAAACCGRCQANPDCVAFVWCGDGGACGQAPGGPPLFGGPAQTGTCVLSSAPLTRVGGGGAAPAAAAVTGRSAWSAGEKACVTGPKDGAAAPAVVVAGLPAGLNARDGRGVGAGAAAMRPADDGGGDDGDDDDGGPGPGTGRYSGAAVAAANNLHPGPPVPRGGLGASGATQHDVSRLPPGLARLAARAAGQTPPPLPPPGGAAARPHGHHADQQAAQDAAP